MSRPKYDFHYHNISYTTSHVQARDCFEEMLPLLVTTMPGKWTGFLPHERIPVSADTREEVVELCQGKYDMEQVLFVKVPRSVEGDGEDCPGNR